MWVPYVECWYPSDLPLSRISSALVVSIAREPESQWIKALRLRATKAGPADPSG